MNKNDFNKGLATGTKLAEGIVKNNVDAVDRMAGKLGKIDENVKDINDTIVGYIDEREKEYVQRQLNIITQISLKDLDDNEKMILGNILNFTAEKFGTNEDQKAFLKNYQKAAGVSIEDVFMTGFNGEAIMDTVDSLSVIRYMYQILNDFLYLYNNTTEFGDTYDCVLNWFMGIVNSDDTKKTTEFKVKLYGKDMLIEQFVNGFFTEDDEENGSKLESFLPVDDRMPYKEIYLPCAKEYFNLTARGYSNCFETKSYIILLGIFNDSIKYIDKETHEVKDLEITKDMQKDDIRHLIYDKNITNINDTLIYLDGNSIALYDLKSEKKTRLPDYAISKLNLTGVKRLHVDGNDLIYIKKEGRYVNSPLALYVYSLKNQKEYKISNNLYSEDGLVFTISDHKIYSVTIESDEQSIHDKNGPLKRCVVSVFNLGTDESEYTFDLNEKLRGISQVRNLDFNSVTFLDNKLFFIGEVDERDSYSNIVFDSIVIDFKDRRVLKRKIKSANQGMDSKKPFITKEYIIYVTKDHDNNDGRLCLQLCCIDLKKLKVKLLHSDFKNTDSYETGLFKKKTEYVTKIKYYDAIGYWIMYDNDYYGWWINNKNDTKNYIDLREIWDTEQ